jgi:hypothetical protein
VDSDDALMDDQKEIADDSAEDEAASTMAYNEAGGVLGGRSDRRTGVLPAVEIDEEAEGDYAVGEQSGFVSGGGCHRRPGPRPAVHIDEDIFRSHCTRAGPDKLTDCELALVCRCTLARVKRLKVLLGLTGLGKGVHLSCPIIRACYLFGWTSTGRILFTGCQYVMLSDYWLMSLG